MASTWIQKPVNKIILISSSLLFVVTVTLLIWGIVTHKEEGLLEVCWEGNNTVLIDNETKNCNLRNKSKIRWNRNQIPLSIRVEDYQGNLLQKQTQGYNETRRAVENLNSQMGFNLFEMAEMSHDLVLKWGIPFEQNENSAGYCQFFGYNGIPIRAEIGIRDISSIRLTFKILLHELGHAAGLAHDDFESSIMFPIARDDTARTPVLSTFTDADIRILRKLYYE